MTYKQMQVILGSDFKMASMIKAIRLDNGITLYQPESVILGFIFPTFLDSENPTNSELDQMLLTVVNVNYSADPTISYVPIDDIQDIQLALNSEAHKKVISLLKNNISKIFSSNESDFLLSAESMLEIKNVNLF